MDKDLINPAWGRILEIARYASEQTGKTVTPLGLAVEAGLLNPCNIQCIKFGRVGITRQFALSLSRRYPAFGPLWIMGRSEKKAAGPFAPLAGRWLRRATYQLSPKSTEGAPYVWEPCPMDERQGDGFGFGTNGTYSELVVNKIMSTGFYTFNAATGELVTGNDEQQIVVTLTGTDLEVLDWTMFLRPVKFHYKRV